MPRSSVLLAPVVAGDAPAEGDAVRLGADGSLALEPGESIVARSLAAPSIPGGQRVSEFSALIATDRRVVWVDPSGGAPGPSMLERITGGAIRRPGVPRRADPTALGGQARFEHVRRIALRPRASMLELDVATENGVVTVLLGVTPGGSLRTLTAALVGAALRARGDANAERVDVRGRDDREWAL